MEGRAQARQRGHAARTRRAPPRRSWTTAHEQQHRGGYDPRTPLEELAVPQRVRERAGARTGATADVDTISVQVHPGGFSAHGPAGRKARLDHVVELKIADQLLISRITSRRMHAASGRTYHNEFQ